VLADESNRYPRLSIDYSRGPIAGSNPANGDYARQTLIAGLNQEILREAPAILGSAFGAAARTKELSEKDERHSVDRRGAPGASRWRQCEVRGEETVNLEAKNPGSLVAL